MTWIEGLRRPERRGRVETIWHERGFGHRYNVRSLLEDGQRGKQVRQFAEAELATPQEPDTDLLPRRAGPPPRGAARPPQVVMTLPPLVAFRWIRLGEDYRYQPRPGTGLDDRRGESCTVRIIGRAGGPRNCLVEFADGHQHVCNWGVLGLLR